MLVPPYTLPFISPLSLRTHAGAAPADRTAHANRARAELVSFTQSTMQLRASHHSLHSTSRCTAGTGKTVATPTRLGARRATLRVQRARVAAPEQVCVCVIVVMPTHLHAL